MRSRLLPYSLLFIAILITSTILLTQPVMTRIGKDVVRTSESVAQLLSKLLVRSLTEREVETAVKDALKDLDFPLVITDELGIPRAWKGIGVDPDRFTPEELNRPDLLRTDRDFRKLLWYIGRLRTLNAPIPIRERGATVGYLYYGTPPILSYLQIMPFLLLGVGVLSLFGFLLAARSIQKFQIQAFWASLAKGLAHQMGTPVSSLFGWYELLKLGTLNPEVVDGMERDLLRMRSILSRFSKIGGNETLKTVSLTDVVQNILRDSQARFLKNMTVETNIQKGLKVSGEKVLLGWAIENLIKNAFEAKRDRNAKLTLDLKREDTKAILRVADNGKGIPREKRRLLFKREFSTKERGWGVGLVVTRRIIEDIHGGQVNLVYSEPYFQTIFEIVLKLV
jgi:two-component system, sporulation sensor kinase D